MYKDLMIDWETLSTQPNAMVLSIGMVLFNLEDEDNYDTLAIEDRYLYLTMPLKEQELFGRHVDVTNRTGTLAWWVKQGRQAQAVFDENPSGSLAQCMAKITKFCGTRPKNMKMWGNGASFDNPIMRSLYADAGVEFPIPYWGDRCLRTLKDLASSPKISIDKGVAHNALADAKYQVLMAQAYYKSMSGE